MPFHKKNNTDGDEKGLEEEIIVDADTDTPTPSIESQKALKEKLRTCMSERAEYLAGWQRSKADYINVRREAEISASEKVLLGKEAVISDILSVLDSFDLAFSHTRAWDELPETWRTGMKHIHKNLLDTLHVHGLSMIGNVGDTFDPLLHQSVDSIAVTDARDDHVIQKIVQSGYAIRGKIIRPAHVIVGVFTSTNN